MKLVGFIAVACALYAIPVFAADAPLHGGNYANRPQAKKLIKTLADKYRLDPDWVRARLTQARYQPRILAAMRRPAEKVLTWHQYRQIFLKPDRIAGGIAFVRHNADSFARAQKTYGVPAPIIAAIIGVETRYGKFVGHDRVLDALATLGFDYPKRGAFFRSELGQFLVLAKEEKLKPDQVLGSYAGAMGLPQFIPSSYRAYAVDFDHDGRRDLWSDPADVIGSVANYFAKHGWHTGQRVSLRGRVGAQAALSGLARARRKTHYTYADLAAAGVTAADPPKPDTPSGLLQLQGADGPEYWIALHNFFVITHYNHSPLYAMAVTQLAAAIKRGLSGPVARR